MKLDVTFSSELKVSDGEYDEGYEDGKGEGYEEGKADTEEIKADIENIKENKLDKKNDLQTVYAINDLEEQINIRYGKSAIEGYLAQREDGGNISVPYKPLYDDSATSKKYVDDSKAEVLAKAEEIKADVSNIKKRVENLESQTLAYTEDSTIAYEKTVPSGVAPYALLKSIGGASKASKNILNPKAITSNRPITVNKDGSITVIDYAARLTTPELEPGTYYLAIETISGWINIITIQNTYEWVSPNTSFTLTEKSALEIELGDLTNTEGEAENFTLKIAIFKGSAKQEFEPFYSGFKHAEVEKIESKGVNLIPFPYEEEEDKTVGGITYTIQADRGIRRVGTATSTSWITLSTNIEFEDGKTYYKSPKDLQISYKRADGSTGYASPSFTWSKEYTLTQVYIQTNPGDVKNEVAYPMISSSKTDYIPYREPQVIEIPEEEIKALVDGYGMGKNYIRWNDGKVEHVQVAKSKTMTSSLLWEAYPHQSSTGAYVYYTVINDKKVGDNTSICSAFENKSYAWASGASGQYSDHQTNTTLYFCSDIATLDEWKAWLKTREDNKNPVVIEYELAVPIVTDITHLFPKDSDIFKVEGNGTLRFVNTEKMPVPSTIQYVTRKE